jgi:tRNA C32,U32 (ribose-2'-O)-methylase TrmJ
LVKKLKTKISQDVVKVLFDQAVLSEGGQHMGYFKDKRPKALLMRRLRRFFGRAEPEKEEVAILRGILRNIKPFEK